MFKIIQLSKKPNLFLETVKLIEKNYEYSPTNSYKVDFYPLMNKKNWENCYLVMNKNKLIGHVGTKPRTLDIAPQQINCVFIGGIVIDENYQNKGVFRLVFNQILDILKMNFDYAFLWSDKVEMYKKFHFKPLSFCNLTISQSDTCDTLLKSNYRLRSFKQLTNSERHQIRKLYKDKVESSFITPLRTKKNWEEIESTSSIKLYVKYKESNISSYCLLGKGQDYQNIIHEFAGNDTEKESLRKLKDISIISPSSYKMKADGFTIKIPTALYANLKNRNELEESLKKKDFFISGADSI